VHSPTKRLSLLVFPRHWASAKLHAPRARQHASRLVIELQGRGCEVGRLLNEDERRALTARLTRLVGRIKRSPTQTPRRATGAAAAGGADGGWTRWEFC
jgi:uncharacterized membrane protein